MFFVLYFVISVKIKWKQHIYEWRWWCLLLLSLKIFEGEIFEKCLSHNFSTCVPLRYCFSKLESCSYNFTINDLTSSNSIFSFYLKSEGWNIKTKIFNNELITITTIPLKLKIEAEYIYHFIIAIVSSQLNVFAFLKLIAQCRFRKWRQPNFGCICL